MKLTTEQSVRPEAPPPEARAKMVGWFDPGQLIDTAMKVVVSTLFGRNADRRLLDAIAHHNPDPCDYSTSDELWIDYVADTGDGWNSTYAVAYHSARKTLSVKDPTGAAHDTERGHLLVFGGDEVYPTANRDAYQRKLVAPYRTALAQTAKPYPGVFAIPGNHDWYDSLVAFTRLFCSDEGRWLGGRTTVQKLSYFAVKLPHDWWLIGTDMQLDSDLDDPQLEYFRGIARQMGPHDRVILCVAEPHWIYEARYHKFDPTVNQKNLQVLEETVFEHRVAVVLAGDLHHYRRHEAPDGRQKITAGGGGAFLYPTHADQKEVEVLAQDYRCKAAYPPPAKSRRLSWRNLAFPFVNPTFGIGTGLLYLLLGWAVKADLSNAGVGQFGDALRITLTATLQSQIAVLWGLLLFLGFYYFTDTNSPRYKLWGGSAHGAAHLLAAFFIGWWATRLTTHYFPFGSIAQLSLAGVLIVALGYVVGAEIMGVYLVISVNVFGRQAGEAFSSLHCEDYKSWLRIHVTPQGALKLYPIGIDRVPRAWRDGASAPDAQGEWSGLLVPADDRASEPALIEVPVAVERSVVAPTDAYAARPSVSSELSRS